MKQRIQAAPKKLTIAASFALAFAAQQAMAATITNPGFESSWDGWVDSDPSSLSSVAHSGSKSAKISGSGGSVEQVVAVNDSTSYQLQAYIKGFGRIGVIVDGSNYSATGGGSDFELVTVDFQSGSASSVVVYGEYDGAEGRFDSFALIDQGGTPTEPPAGKCNDVLSIANASDDGGNDGNGPANTIDNNLNTRWSYNGVGKQIVWDLGGTADISAMSLAFYKGDQRSASFDLEISSDASNWTPLLTSANSGGSSLALESFAIADTNARYVRYTGYGNSANTWNSLTEVQVNGCNWQQGGGEEPVDPPVTGNLDPNLPPSGNFDLLDWTLGVPVDNDGDGKSDTIKEIELSSGYEHSSWFYTDSDGGMVFKAPVDAPKTSTNTSYTRSELREMLRRGDTSYSTKGVGGNNWVFSSAPSSAQNAAGGVDGLLTATLAVNHVTTTGDSSQQGRVIIGQIHANDDEPVRIYYRKLKNNAKGSIYIAHEPRTGSEQYYEMIGSRSSSASNPVDGIALDEQFSYSIRVVGNTLTVTIMRDGKADVVQQVDMSASGYDDSSQYMYFKAGVYNQNNTGDGNDYVQATFYALDNTHTGYNP
ncbi:hypothetical protein GCM10011369_31830 [Neiella marina]|uniref:F5/8 type C domain-containing protein n=1 Tax=Neiella marina TaxID=508461 RepID=A0A8J2XR35_9GAMM|nr:polysaccharide lyase family 7 protein [Neiella marina]GGA87412.1 hypothetical protein GCM10011369_31830 [Neiella marina]